MTDKRDRQKTDKRENYHDTKGEKIVIDTMKQTNIMKTVDIVVMTYLMRQEVILTINETERHNDNIMGYKVIKQTEIVKQ